ncbi:MAG: hypothetical protein ACI8X5_004007 [Planctomycetota bacterium]|jgi:uncharacterized protein YbjT (DUF2867 family)
MPLKYADVAQQQESADETTGSRGRVLVTGASGYIGGRLVPRLLEAGYRVRCMARSPRKLADRPWSTHPNVEVVEADAEHFVDVRAALQGCDAAYYLIHSMIVAGEDYSERDRRLSTIFAKASAEEKVGRIIYLGGLGETGAGLSEHLSSRREVEQCLASTSVPVTVLRAAMIIGSGSASFEILRYLVERLPAMITPRWVSTRCQPIAIRNVLHYLTACLETPGTIGKRLDIGGSEIFTYRQLMAIMAEARGLPTRLIVAVPILTPRLSSLWIHLVTPISARVGRPLAEGLKNEVICRNNEAAQLMPQELLTVRYSIDLGLQNLRESHVETTWTNAGPMAGDPDWSGGDAFRDSWQIDVDASPQLVFRSVCRIGGGHGWYAADALWKIRGSMDRLVGGPGLRRGRRDPDHVAYGDALDFWRVTDVLEPRRLILRAEMKLPGLAQLGFDVIPLEGGRTRLVQTALFIPRGLAGLAYWYAVLPFHGFVFRGMLKGIRRSAESAAGSKSEGTERVQRVN